MSEAGTIRNLYYWVWGIALAAHMVSSEYLYQRRVGILLFPPPKIGTADPLVKTVLGCNYK